MKSVKPTGQHKMFMTYYATSQVTRFWDILSTFIIGFLGRFLDINDNKAAILNATHFWVFNLLGLNLLYSWRNKIITRDAPITSAGSDSAPINA